MRTLVLLALALSIACGETAPPAVPPAPEPEAEVTPLPAPLPPATDVVPEPVDTAALPVPPAPSAEDAAIVGAGSRSLGAGLLRALAAPAGESVAIAPGSILAAVGMVAAGARGETRDQILTTLGVAALGDRTSAVLGGTLGALAGDDLALANRVYARSDLTIETGYLDTTRDLFRAPLESVVFDEAARVRINGWVSERTHERIPEILPAGSIDGTTALVLVNAMYFLAPWETSFEATETRDDFFRAPAGRVTCRMMRRTGRIAYGRTDDATVVNLPYGGDRFVATFVLPNDEDGMPALEASLDGEHVAAWVAAARPRDQVELEIPRFRVEATAPTRLGPALRSMGMELVFDSTHADLSGIAPPPAPLFLQEVFHRVFIETTERGTEAAAATAGVIAVRGMGPVDPAPHFRADRPFLFLVTDRASGLVLFLARVATPGSPSTD